jgi:hypothetical protein
MKEYDFLSAAVAVASLKLERWTDDCVGLGRGCTRIVVLRAGSLLIFAWLFESKLHEGVFLREAIKVPLDY